MLSTWPAPTRVVRDVVITRFTIHLEHGCVRAAILSHDVPGNIAGCGCVWQLPEFAAFLPPPLLSFPTSPPDQETLLFPPENPERQVVVPASRGEGWKGGKAAESVPRQARRGKKKRVKARAREDTKNKICAYLGRQAGFFVSTPAKCCVCRLPFAFFFSSFFLFSHFITEDDAWFGFPRPPGDSWELSLDRQTGLTGYRYRPSTVHVFGRSAVGYT